MAASEDHHHQHRTDCQWGKPDGRPSTDSGRGHCEDKKEGSNKLHNVLGHKKFSPRLKRCYPEKWACVAPKLI
jgi:hypothetical protein